MDQFPMRRERDPRRTANTSRIPLTIDHYEYGNRAPEVTGPYTGGQNSMLYRGGYTHDAGSFTLIHGGNQMSIRRELSKRRQARRAARATEQGVAGHQAAMAALSRAVEPKQRKATDGNK